VDFLTFKMIFVSVRGINRRVHASLRIVPIDVKVCKSAKKTKPYFRLEASQN